MRVIQGFVEIASLVNNNVNQVAPLGELSSFSMTYAKDKTVWGNALYPDYSLTCFKAFDDATSTVIPVEADDLSRMFKVLQLAIQYASSHTQPYIAQDFRNTVIAEVSDSVTNLQFGKFKSNGNIALPEWISFRSIDNGSFYRYWLADSAFGDQYDDYVIEVIPPIENIDKFFMPFAQVVEELAKQTLVSLTQLIEEKKGPFPETYLRFNEYVFKNINNPNQSVKTEWTLIVYGKAGSDIDKMKDAVIDYVMSHTHYTREQWEHMFPELFKRTEFVLVPRWDKLAIEDMQELSGLYASIMDPAESVTFAKNAVTFYSPAFVESNVSIFPFDYKAITILSINGMNNSDYASNLRDIFPDYLPINSNSLDHSRMSPVTRAWVVLLEGVLMIAESADEYTSLPYHVRRTYKDGKMFFSFVYQNVNYLVMAKMNEVYK